MHRFRPLAAILVLALVTSVAGFSLAGAEGKNGRALIKTEELKSWLEAFSSDEFEGRRLYSEGLGLSAAYLAYELKAMGVRPGGDHGSYYQRVSVRGVKSDNKSAITVEAGGQTRTFANGEGITFPANVGARRSFASGEIVFAGYGLDAPGANHNDYAGLNVKGKVVVWLGAAGPRGVEAQYRRILSGRARYATDVQGASAVIGPVQRTGTGRPPTAPQAAPPQAAAGPAGPGPQGPRIETPDFTTAQRLDNPIPPSVAAQDEFFEFLLAGQEYSYADLKVKANERTPLPVFPLKSVRVTFHINAEYQVVRTQFTRNVVGIVDGADEKLKHTYVAFGSHYDHMGYAEGELVQTADGLRRAEPRGGVKGTAMEDRIWNGADDDGSGSVAMLALAKAFQLGERPMRSLIFVWHTGEESGLYGSRYFADFPSVPLESIVAQINLDMIGRNRDDKPGEENTVYVIGSDRISTELHNLAVEANGVLEQPLKLDFELNDPADLEQFYFRSDHYSYAAKGIPVVFFTTGIHPDYHFNTDSVDKIQFGKMTRITQLCYELGLSVANLDHAPIRDNKGPRAGKLTTGKLQQ